MNINKKTHNMLFSCVMSPVGDLNTASSSHPSYSSERTQKTALVFVGGDAPYENIIDWEYALIVVADSGFYTCKQWGLVPDVVIGDFDSVSQEEVHRYAPHAELHEYRSDKDKTDSEIALAYVYAQEYDDISIIGGVGQRLDHFLGILSLFKNISHPHRVIGDQYQLEYIAPDTSIEIDCRTIEDQYLSFFPLSPSTIQHTEGLRWELSDIVLSDAMYHSLHSLSNEYVGDKVTIKMKEGALLAVWRHGGRPRRSRHLA